MKKLNVLYTIDENYCNQLLVSMFSLLENNRDKDIINIHIICDELSKNSIDLINRLANKFENAEVNIYDAKIIYERLKEYKLTTYRGALAPTLRLFYSFVIDDIDNLLYLDADTLVVGSLNTDTMYMNYPVSACLDHMAVTHKESLDKSLKHYYNSGVLFIDHKKFKELSCQERILDTIKRNDKQLNFFDQDILNMALNGHISILPLYYNVFSTDVYFKHLHGLFYKSAKILDFYSQSEVNYAINNPRILHVTDLYGIRPWQENNIHPFNDIYDKYANLALENYVKEEIPFSQNKVLFKLEKTSKILLKCTKDKIKELMIK